MVVWVVTIMLHVCSSVAVRIVLNNKYIVALKLQEVVDYVGVPNLYDNLNRQSRINLVPV